MESSSLGPKLTSATAVTEASSTWVLASRPTRYSGRLLTPSLARQESGDFLLFKNIRYGQPPVDKLRFMPPVSYEAKKYITNDGKDGFVCPQAYPDWSIKAWAELQGISVQGMRQGLESTTPQSEDCLFLDVRVPRLVWQRRAGSRNWTKFERSRKSGMWRSRGSSVRPGA